MTYETFAEGGDVIYFFVLPRLNLNNRKYLKINFTNTKKTKPLMKHQPSSTTP